MPTATSRARAPDDPPRPAQAQLTALTLLGLPRGLPPSDQREAKDTHDKDSNSGAKALAQLTATEQIEPSQEELSRIAGGKGSSGGKLFEACATGQHIKEAKIV